MKCVLLVAGHGASLEAEVRADESGRYAHLEGVPKALMPGVPPKSTRILDYWWDSIKGRQLFSDVYLVTNADKFKHFERWATASDFPDGNLINDGTTSRESRLGSVADLGLCLRARRIVESGEDVCVIAGDMLFQDQQFDLSQVVKFHLTKRSDGDTAIYYELDETEDPSRRGIIEVCPFSSRITKFLEKPKEGETTSRKASVVFYCFRAETLTLVDKYLTAFPEVRDRSMGKFIKWLLDCENATIYGMKLPTGFQLIGQTTLADYEHWLQFFGEQQLRDKGARPRRITKRAYARVGLMGNPSDGFFGKTISLSIRNFWAEVTIFESAKLVLVPHPLCDPTEFGSLADLHGISSKEGYLGGLRLLQATCKKFHHYCCTRGIALAKRNFTLKYDTNIPRQVGLAGSSAIVTATLKCLMEFFHVTESDLPKERQPQFILDVEVAELSIAAGLQDRVVQIYEGLVYMDFSEELMKSQGFGNYERLDVKHLPTLYLSYLSDPSDSGKIHSNIRQRFDAGEEEVLAAMRRFAELTAEARRALSCADWPRLSELMDENFALRRSVYGDDCLGRQNLRMAEIGRQFGAACKFPGSGGAIVGLLPDADAFEDLKKAYEAEGYVVTKIRPNVPSS